MGLMDPEEWPTLPKCTACGVRRAGNYRWKMLSADDRRVLRANGVNVSGSRGMCKACYQRDLYEPAREAAWPPRPLADVVEDWRDLSTAREGLSQAQAIRDLAPRMSMSPKALEQAVLRAKRKGLIAA